MNLPDGDNGITFILDKGIFLPRYKKAQEVAANCAKGLKKVCKAGLDSGC